MSLKMSLKYLLPHIPATTGLTHLPLDKMTAISQRQYFEMHFREWKSWYLDKNFTEVCS